MTRRAKLFANGRSQAVRLPKEFRFTGTEVNIERRGDAVVLTPVEGKWAKILRELVPVDEATAKILLEVHAEHKKRRRSPPVDFGP